MSTHNFNKILCSGQGRVTGPFVLSPESVAWKNPVASKTTTIAKDDMLSAFWISVRTGCQLKLNVKGGTTLRYTGFKSSDLQTFKEHFQENFNISLELVSLNCKGGNWGDFEFDGNGMRLTSGNEMVVEFPLSEKGAGKHVKD
eukprot:g493.t1